MSKVDGPFRQSNDGRGGQWPPLRQAPQAAYQVNCPFCGAIAQVVCPRPGIVPRSVQAHSCSAAPGGRPRPKRPAGVDEYLAPILFAEMQLGCTNAACGKRIVVDWHFDPK
jgi:hypothetical protein